MSNQLFHKDVFRIMEEWAPKSYAYDWDNVGLQVGSYQHRVKKIMVTLDVLEAVVDEAIQKNVNLIIAHHPLLFKSLKQINYDSPQGRTISKILKHDITVYAAHTNLDVAYGGVNDALCDKLQIEEREVLLEIGTDDLFKLVCFVPNTHVNDVRNAISEAGAGHIGNYSHCTFQTKGEGTFKPLEGTNPFIGNQGQLEFVNEMKIESIVPQSILSVVLKEMLKAHPYEEPAYDIYPLNNRGKPFGIGRIGTLKSPMLLSDYISFVKSKLGLSQVRVTGNLEKKVKKVAILGGSGEKYIQLAKKKGADVYITGDMSFHIAQDAWQMGLAVIDAGHYIEEVIIETTRDYLSKELESHGVEIITSKINTNPFQFI